MLLYACSQTQLATHITKKVIKESEIDISENKNAIKRKVIYKIGDPYIINGIKYTPKEEKNYIEEGIASWYGPNFHGKLTANGEIFNQYDITAAHKTLPLPSIVRVTNLENNREIVVRINDRGPFVGNRIIDLSLKSAQMLGIERKGTAKVKLQLLDYGPHLLERNKIIEPEKKLDKIFYIQVGAFNQARNAAKYAEKLRNSQFVKSKINIKTIYKGEEILYIVRIGPLKSNDDALYVKRTLENNNINSKIILEPIS